MQIIQTLKSKLSNNKFYASLLAVFIVVVTMTAEPVREHFSDSSETRLAKVDYFHDLDLEAKAVYVYDLNTKKVLFAKNENESLPLASLTKLMTALTATKLAPQTSIVNIDREAMLENGDSGFRTDEKWSLASLLKFMLVMSSNDGAAAVAMSLGGAQDGNRSGFIDSMNANAISLGLNQTKFYNESGLDVSSTTAGAYGSASDVSKLLEYSLKNNLNVIEPTRYASIQVKSLNQITHIADNTDMLAGKIPGLIAGKTGWSDLAQGNLALAFNAGLQHPIIVVVLGSSYDGRFVDAEKLVNASLQSVSN